MTRAAQRLKTPARARHQTQERSVNGAHPVGIARPTGRLTFSHVKDCASETLVAEDIL